MNGRLYAFVTLIWLLLCHYAAVGELYFHPSDEWSRFDIFFAWSGGFVQTLYIPVTAVLVVIAAVFLWKIRKKAFSGLIRFYTIAGLLFLALTFLGFRAITIAAIDPMYELIPDPPPAAIVHRAYAIGILDAVLIAGMVILTTVEARRQTSVHSTRA